MTNFPSDIIFTKSDASTGYEQVEKLTRGFNAYYRYFIESLIYLLSKRVDLSFVVHKLENISSNPSKINFEGLVHLLEYIRDNNTQGFKYYDDMSDAPVSDLLIQASIKTGNHLMAFYDSIWKYFSDTGRITGAYIIFYQCGQFDHGTHVPGPVSQSSAENEYNIACTAGMSLAHFRILIHDFFNKDSDIVTQEDPLIIFDSKSALFMDNNGKDNNHTRHIARRVHFVRNGEKCKMNKIDWCEGGLQWADIATKNIGDNDLNPRIMVRLNNLQRTTLQEG